MGEQRTGSEAMGGNMGEASRRGMLAGAAAAGVAAGLPGWARATTGARQVAGFEPALVPSAAQLGRWLKQLHDFGPIRATGTPQARAFEDFLAREFAALGFQ